MDEKTDESLSDTWKSRRVGIQEIRDRNYNIDICGFPVQEKVVLSPEETVANFKAERDRLDAALDAKLDQILQMLGVAL